MRSQGSARHLVDGDLIRYVDAEGNDEETRLWDSHVARCVPCREAVASLRADSVTISSWLAAADFENALGRVDQAGLETRTRRTVSTNVVTPAPLTAPSSGGSPTRRAWIERHRSGPRAGPWLKAAAITLLMAAPVAAIPGVRDWVVERVSLLRSDVAAPSATATADPTGTAPAVIRFVPAPGSFTVVIEAVPAGGTFDVVRVTGPEAIFEVTSGQPGSSPVVGARGIRIGESAGSLQSYRLSVPPQVDAVLVDVGGRQIRLDGAALQRPASIPLSNPHRSR